MSKMAASPHLCLRWNNYQSNLTSVFDQLLQNETFVDVTLAADGHAIKAHRMVLSACSPYFQALFFDNPCQHPIVILKDTRWSELKAIVEYMYRGEISVAQEELTSLLRVAETLKIRGLSELNGDRHANMADDRSETTSPATAVTPITGIHSASAATTAISASGKRMESPTSSWPLQAQPWSHGEDTPTPSPSPAPIRSNKRRRVSTAEANSTPGPGSPDGSTPSGGPLHEDASLDGPLPLVGHTHQSPASSTAASTPAIPVVSTLSQSLSTHPQQTPSHPDDLDIKPGIAELIREEERARMLEGTHPWLTASPSVLSDTYQYQLQALWQKAWATGQGVMQNLRFRERGPFKTWRPETMAEAIMAVLREGLSLSQAARKFDIPYPTFVLYANRVNNMLGPSADGGSGNHLMELRPKGRGRPQRILTGSWPEDHVHGVIRAVVFRDPSSLPRHFEREDASKLTANRPSMTRLLVPAQQSIQGELGNGNASGMRALIPNSINNGNGNNNNEFAMPSSSSNISSGGLIGSSSNYPPLGSMRSMAGPSSSTSNGIDMMGNGNGNNNNNNNNNILSSNLGSSGNMAGSSNSCLAGGGLTSSSLFSVLQQEVAEETRLAALNAMTQRLMTSLEGETMAPFGMGGMGAGPGNMNQQLSCNQQQQQLGGRSSNPAMEAAWFGPNGNFAGQLPLGLAAEDVATPDEVEAVEHLATFDSHTPTGTAVHVKQEQLFGD